MKKILYISTNDGSDMRINKEVKSLSQCAKIYFLGVGYYGVNNYAKKYCEEFHLIQEKRNSIKAVIKHLFKFLQWNRVFNFNSIHIINEQLMLFFYPFLFNKYVVLDLFDSFFLKINKPGKKLKIIKQLVYAPINYIFVTDNNRKELMPHFLRNKLGVLENYPNQYKGLTKKENKELTIFYNGSMSYSRGTEILLQLTEKFEDIKVIMAGWLSDEATTNFSKSPNVNYRGIITQEEATKIAAIESDYIMCCYEPNNQNNINASPNKIFDAIQTNTPVIINREVNVADFVYKEGLGVIIDSFYDFDINLVANNLIKYKNTFVFDEKSKKKYSWENIESKLLKAHQLF